MTTTDTGISIQPNTEQNVVRDARTDFQYYYGDWFRTAASAAQTELTSNKVEMIFLITMMLVIVAFAVLFFVRTRQDKYATKKATYDIGVAVQTAGGQGLDAITVEQ